MPALTSLLLRCTVYRIPTHTDADPHQDKLKGLGRFSEPALLILASLAGGPKHGYAIMQDVARFHGTRLEPGTLYGALARLEPRGWIAPQALQGRRRPYRLTKEGANVLRSHVSVMQSVVSTALDRLAPSAGSWR
jgi:DNA-binding PadR family transcriptional regulator